MIRTATEKDAERLLEIYSYYVENTAVTFEYETPSTGEFRNRITSVLKKYPYLVCENNGTITGYAYAGSFKARRAYDWAVETTIYIDKNERRKGTGRELYTALEKALSLQNIINLNAYIAFPEEEDEYLTKNSVNFHNSMGYRIAGELHKCGYKFNRWYNLVLMEKCISDNIEKPDQVIPFKLIRKELEEKYGIL